jgi:hypothetical protein
MSIQNVTAHLPKRTTAVQSKSANSNLYKENPSVQKIGQTGDR